MQPTVGDEGRNSEQIKAGVGPVLTLNKRQRNQQTLEIHTQDNTPTIESQGQWLETNILHR